MEFEWIDSGCADNVNAALTDWFVKNRRELSFREDRDPYKIWISEIMAQQTRIDTLLPYFDRFIERFPDVHALAQAPEDDVLKAWEGLGYYSRARNLHKCAQILDEQGFPHTYEELVKLPGIGPYTAGAIASIAFGQKAAAVDGNVLRVMSRIYASDRDIMDQKTRKLLKKELEATMPGETAIYTESLMELGALICSPKSPKCLICPVRDHCQAYRQNLTETLPVKKKKEKPVPIQQVALIIESPEGILFEKRPEGELLAGLWGLPVLDLAQKSEIWEKIRRTQNPVPLGNSRHVFTHRIWESQIFLLRPESRESLNALLKDLSLSDETAWVPEESFSDLSIPTAFKKMLDLYLKKRQK